MNRRLAYVAIVISSCLGLAACGSSGTNTQPFTPSPPPSSTSSSPTSPSSSSSDSSDTATSPTSASGSATPPSVPTPTVTPPAQSAVDAYTGASNVLFRWDRDPQKATSSELAPYVTSTVLAQILSSYRSMAQAGLAYRGTPDQSHITVIASSSTSVAFSDCPTPSATDPYTQYVVATGKPVAATTPAGLHPKAVTAVLQDGRWRISEITPNLAKTCTA